MEDQLCYVAPDALPYGRCRAWRFPRTQAQSGGRASALVTSNDFQRFGAFNPFMSRNAIGQRYRCLLRVNNIARSKSTAEGIFNGVCRALKNLVPYDRAGLSLFDPDRDALRIVGIYGPHKNSMFRVGHLLNRSTTQTGWVFDQKTRMLRRDLTSEFKFSADQSIFDEGYRCVCSVPLVLRGDSIGAVTVLGARKNQLSSDHAELVQEMSDQIVLAISSLTPRCPTHTSTKLVCPRCIGAAGGKTTVAKHRADLSTWGKKGGRGRRNLDFS